MKPASRGQSLEADAVSAWFRVNLEVGSGPSKSSHSAENLRPHAPSTGSGEVAPWTAILPNRSLHLSRHSIPAVGRYA